MKEVNQKNAQIHITILFYFNFIKLIFHARLKQKSFLYLYRDNTYIVRVLISWYWKEKKEKKKKKRNLSLANLNLDLCKQYNAIDIHVRSCAMQRNVYRCRACKCITVSGFDGMYLRRYHCTSNSYRIIAHCCVALDAWLTLFAS